MFNVVLPGCFVKGQTLQQSLPVPIQLSLDLGLQDHTRTSQVTNDGDGNPPRCIVKDLITSVQFKNKTALLNGFLHRILSN